MLRAAVIGVGSMGQHHARVYNELEDVTLVGVADATEATARRIGGIYKVPAYIDYQEMLDTEKPDIVSVATPTSLHHDTAMAVMDRGIHLLVEKPIAATLADAGNMVKRAHDAGLRLAVGHIERYNPAIEELKRRLDAGELGTIFQFHSRRLSPYPDRIQDAGVVLDLAIHELDVMTCLDETPVERIYAETRRRVHPQREDMLTGLLRFSSGAVGVLDINWLTPTKIRTLSVTGERGMFVVNYLLQDLAFYENTRISADAWGILEILGVGEGNMVRYRISKMEPLRREIEAFASAVERDEPPPVTGEDGVRALKLALAINESADTGQAVEMSVR